MKNEHGIEMIRLDDPTDHGGEVIECTNDLRQHGIDAALEGHGVRCPTCGGVSPLLASGQRVGYHGDKTGCGATVIGPRTTGAT
ncbi:MULTISPECIES: PAAR domain-containing protein [Burkholderia]|uniref:PAAR repeat-containing protein n=1 Tax=Burkholderia paludis TaxID=1506587 RepID=A0A6J5DNI6_9BURK|nr:MULTISPECIES: PAAR domain-containing protein [Burkholderia]CAB3754366.1 hypothetical protein LMG30113_02218 [Burkholderia paludis]VWB77115.1 PAAR repeat-containing protein [Burkholderia paludis]